MENQQNQTAEVVKTTDWLLAYLLVSIPVVNLVMLFIWAFGSDTNPNKSNWAKAGLIWMAIIIGLYTIFGLIFGLAFFASQS